MQEPSEAVDDLAWETIGAALDVHRELGPGFLESVYEEALSVALAERGIAHARQVAAVTRFHGKVVGSHRLDILVGGSLIVELKAVETLMPIHRAQVISYLKTTGHQLALLMNFNTRELREGIQRIVLTKHQANR